MKNDDILNEQNNKDKKRRIALGMAVTFAITASVGGCAIVNAQKDKEDDSYYYGGGGHGSYFFYSGGSYRGSSWGKNFVNTGGHAYSTHRAGSFGG